METCSLPSCSQHWLTLSKWLKEARNSFICSWLIPLASRVRIWFSTSLMVLAIVVSNCSQPTRICWRKRTGQFLNEKVALLPPSPVDRMCYLLQMKWSLWPRQEKSICSEKLPSHLQWANHMFKIWILTKEKTLKRLVPDLKKVLVLLQSSVALSGNILGAFNTNENQTQCF